MKKQLFISPIGRAMLEAEQSKQDRNSGYFLVVIWCLAVIEAIAQVIMFFG